MKFVVSSAVLLKQLSAISGVISPNPIVPILENFLFQVDGNKLIVTASDLQTVMSTEVGVESDQKFSIAVPAKLLLDTLRGLAEQPVTFNIDTETFGAEIVSENGRYKLSGENPIDFPKTAALGQGLNVTIASSTLATAISNTVFAASTDDHRPAMTGVFIQLGLQGATFVATDGHRLVRYRRHDIKSDSEMSVVIQRKALGLLKASLPAEDVPVETRFTAANAYFGFGNIKMICRLIDERFPDFENAIPVNNPNKMTIVRADLVNSLKRIDFYSNRTTHQVRMKLSPTSLLISAEDLDYSNEASETLACEFKGEEMEIGFNARFLIEMLGNVSSKNVDFELSKPNKAGLIIPFEQADEEDFLMLVMPVMLNTYA